MNKTYINLGLFLAGGLILWFLAFPLYAGKGENILGVDSVLQIKKELEQKQQELSLAKDLQKRAGFENENFSNISNETKSQIDQMIPASIDIPRLFNNISVMAAKSGISLDDITYSKYPSPDNLSQLSAYKINLALSGDYVKLKTFLKSLETSLQLYRISSMSFTSKESSDTTNQDDKGQKFNVIFDAYEYKN